MQCTRLPAPLFSVTQGVAAQGWEYVDNELHRMERHPAQAVKPGFQSRREVSPGVSTMKMLVGLDRRVEQNLSASRQYSGDPRGHGGFAYFPGGRSWVYFFYSYLLC